jgi:hypothetical protein
MKTILDIAASISTPVALAGFAAAVFLIVLRQVIAKGIFPRLTRQLSSEIIKLAIDRAFLLSALTAVLGFLAYLLGVPHATHPNKPIPVLIAQLEEIKEVAKLFEGGEDYLYDNSDLQTIFDNNMARIIAEYRKVFFAENYEAKSLVGETAKIMQGGGGMVDMETGSFTPEKSNRLVKYIVLSKKHNEHLRRLGDFADSIFLHEKARSLVQEYIEILEENTMLLGDVLDECAREFSSRYKSADTKFETIWIHNRWAQNYKELSPKADEIRSELRRYVANAK